MRHECSYCGGWGEKQKEDEVHIDTVVDFKLVIEESESKDKRNICIKCLIKAFDTILGKPIGG